MKTKELFSLTIKYIKSYARRYLFLFSALSFGFCIVTIIVSLKDGMTDSVYYSARSHYSGDIIITGLENGADGSKNMAHIKSETIPAIRQALDQPEIDAERIVYRTLMTGEGYLFYNGNAARFKYLTGVDWQNETDYFKSLNFIENIPPSDFNEDTLLLSAPVAEFLGAKTGDSILLETDNRFRQKNTASFTVGGVIQDSSIFGYYKIFISRRAVNTLLGFERDDCSDIGVFLRNRSEVEIKRKKLQARMEQVLPVKPLVYDRDEYNREKDWEWNGVMFFLLTISVYLSEVSQILQALSILTYFLYAMMLLIILVSASVTYRLILHERIKEIGTMRAIGFYENDVRLILYIEAFLLATLSLVTGFCLALFFNRILAGLSFSWFPSFDIFLKNGRLMALYNPLATVVNVVAIYSILFLAVCMPAYRSSRSSLPEMLSGGVKE
jgi:ABC-type lipoprotein release transport system permease subunit